MIILNCATVNFLYLGMKANSNCARASLLLKAHIRGIRIHTSINISFTYVDRVCAASHLVVFVPGQRLGGEHKPVFLRSSLHDPDVVDGQPALPDHLRDAQTHHNDYMTAQKHHLFHCHTLVHLCNSTGKYTLTGSREATQGHSSRSF